MNTKLIKLREVNNLTSMSRSSIYRLIANGEFPAQIKLSERSSAWSLEEVNDWVQSRINDRDKKAANDLKMEEL